MDKRSLGAEHGSGWRPDDAHAGAAAAAYGGGNARVSDDAHANAADAAAAAAAYGGGNARVSDALHAAARDAIKCNSASHDGSAGHSACWVATKF